MDCFRSIFCHLCDHLAYSHIPLGCLWYAQWRDYGRGATLYFCLPRLVFGDFNSFAFFLIMTYEALHLDPDEHVVLEVRKHWIVFVGQAVGLLFTGFLPFVVLTALEIFVPQILTIDIPGNSGALFLFLYSLWLLAIWISFFVNWTKYYLDVWYVTEKRIIIIDQRKIFNREVSNIRFDKVQDVTVVVNGFLSTLLGFGNVKVQTASEDSTDFYMTTVRHPQQVRKVIFGKHNEIGDRN